MDLARDARAFIERRRTSTRRLGLTRLGNEGLCGTGPHDVLATGEAEERTAEKDRRIAECRARIEVRPHHTRLDGYQSHRADCKRLEHRRVSDGLQDSQRGERQRGAAVLKRGDKPTGQSHQRERGGLERGAARPPDHPTERPDVREHREDDQQSSRTGVAPGERDLDIHQDEPGKTSDGQQPARCERTAWVEIRVEERARIHPQIVPRADDTAQRRCDRVIHKPSARARSHT
jgi:hypothetical protein